MDAALPLFLDQHAMVHAARVTKCGLWSFEDELLEAMSDEEIRHIPPAGEHSIAWILFHLTRIEDMTMNMLVAGTPQVFTGQDWGRSLNVSIRHSANKMEDREVPELSARVDLKSPRQYRSRPPHAPGRSNAAGGGFQDEGGPGPHRLAAAHDAHPALFTASDSATFPEGYFYTILKLTMSIKEVHSLLKEYDLVFSCYGTDELYYYFSTDDQKALRFMIHYDPEGKFVRMCGEDDDSRTLSKSGCVLGSLEN